MIINLPYWTKVLKKIIYIFLILLGLFLTVKLSIFYMPFLVAFILYLLMEPGIKWIMRKTKLTRKTSSIIIFITVSILIILILTWGITTIISESSNLLKNLNFYIEKIKIFFQEIISKINIEKINLSLEINQILEKSSTEILTTISNWIRSFLTTIISLVTSFPKIAICFSITVISLYFMCVDKIYMIDQIEHHLPRKWVEKVGRHLKELTKTLGKYIKAEAILVFISFLISLSGLYILKFLKFNINFPLLIALAIGFVDALPILGSGTVMIPWAIISSLNGDLKLGIAIIILLLIISVTKQFLEPKLVSKNIGVHPIFTLISMYTGFRLIGVIGLLIGPIVLIIFKNIFSTFIDKGIIKTIFSKE